MVTQLWAGCAHFYPSCPWYLTHSQTLCSPCEETGERQSFAHNMPGMLTNTVAQQARPSGQAKAPPSPTLAVYGSSRKLYTNTASQACWIRLSVAAPGTLYSHSLSESLGLSQAQTCLWELLTGGSPASLLHLHSTISASLLCSEPFLSLGPFLNVRPLAGKCDAPGGPDTSGILRRGNRVFEGPGYMDEQLQVLR